MASSVGSYSLTMGRVSRLSVSSSRVLSKEVSSPLEGLVCPVHRIPLGHEVQGYSCAQGCAFPVVEGIARFVSHEGYCSSFGIQWMRFRQAQLDSYTHTTISRDRLARCLGGSLDVVRDKLVLEVGCGAGRFTEILLAAGASVFACDLSRAVEANYANCAGRPGYFVCQADLLRLPADPEQFDLVLALGVIQHTPDPERAIDALCAQVKPGGHLVFDHYSHSYPATAVRRALRWLLLRVPLGFRLPFCQLLVGLLWPLHVLIWRLRGMRGAGRLRRLFLNISPILDYQEFFPELGTDALRTWALLDTHDTLTDRYKHLRSVDEIARALRSNGMADIQVQYGGNGVEARSLKPSSPQGPGKR